MLSLFVGTRVIPDGMSASSIRKIDDLISVKVNYYFSHSIWYAFLGSISQIINTSGSLSPLSMVSVQHDQKKFSLPAKSMQVEKSRLSQKKSSVSSVMNSKITHLSEIFVVKSQEISRLSQIWTVIVVFVTRIISQFVVSVPRQTLVQKEVKRQLLRTKK